ncbi:MAG: sensor histidine kinase, partial [Bryobacteraceae bacterium]
LDLVELVGDDGAIISSAQWPARFGFKDEWVRKAGPEASLRKEELPEEMALGLVAVRSVAVGGRKVYVAGGMRIDPRFLSSLVLPEGMRVLLYRSFDKPAGGGMAPLVAEALSGKGEIRRVVGDENFTSLGLRGSDGELLGALLIGSSRRDLIALESTILQLGLGVGGAAVALGLAMAWWTTARVTRPVRRLVDAAAQVSGGDWNAQVDVASSDEIGALAAAFNHMTRQLIEQRERLVQTERVAAWRELARRLAHELKNPLFPLQITVENMRRAKEQHPEQFEEVFRESAQTLLAELANLKSIIGRFSDFAKMPPPDRRAVQLNGIVRDVLKLFHAQFAGAGVAAEARLDESLPEIDADPEQLRRAVQNLVLNALDAMPSGGTVTVRTGKYNGTVRLEISDTGAGLTPEECQRLFTPYYTTKQHGTGLGLAIVQSVVSDHGGRISVASAVGRGTTFRIELQHGATSHS